MPNPRSLLVQPDFVRDPFPRLAELREHDPLYWDVALETWFVTRYEDVRSFFSDPRFSSDRRLGKGYQPPEPGSWMAHFENQSMLTASPPDHRRWRKRVSAGFTPRAVRRMDAQVRDVVELFAAPLRDRAAFAAFAAEATNATDATDATASVDLLESFTTPIPNTVIGRITGIPPYPGDEDRFRHLAQDMMRRYVFFADEENVRRGEAAINELAEWVMKLAEERRQEPRDDLLSDLIVGNTGDDHMTNQEIVVLIAVLVAAGSETTTLGGTQVLRHLLSHPDQMAILRADPSLIRNAVHEALRFDFGSLAAVNPRFALEDISMPAYGQTIRKGQMVMLSPASANRDPSTFPDPDRFDITRDTTNILTFGQGPHYCLGANLAMQEMSCMLEAALGFLPEGAQLVEPGHDWDHWEQIGIMRRPTQLPVRFPTTAVAP